jgi:apolipoprotein N-acyltransferase
MLSKKPDGDNIRITVIQGNIPQDLRWKRGLRKQHLEKHIRLTRDAARGRKSSLIAWPETAVSGSLLHDIGTRRTLSSLAREIDATILVGNAARPKFGPREFRKRNRFNSAILFSPGGPIKKRYNKIRLLPFGEYLPYKDLLPWPSRLASRVSSFIPGKEYTLFSVGGAMFGVAICWENIFPGLFRQFVKNGANFMVNITTEAWFMESAAPYQFMAMSVFRAVENRISIARSANTGISGFIDPYGRIIGKVENGAKDIFVEGYLTRDIPLFQQKTFYTLYGDIFAYLSLAAASLLLLGAFLRGRVGFFKGLMGR